MATVTVKLTLTSTDLTSDSLSLENTQTMTCSQGGVTRYAVTGTTAGAASTLYTGNDQTGPVWLYLKNTDSTAADYVYVFTDDSDDTNFVKLGGGESIWLTLNKEATYKCYVQTAETVIEYGVFA